MCDLLFINGGFSRDNNIPTVWSGIHISYITSAADPSVHLIQNLGRLQEN
jgi:hypothetical protein